jgi:hemerythrin-like domain-containing protein
VLYFDVGVDEQRDGVMVGGPMTMNRVIHAAVRRDLGRLEAALGRAGDGDVVRAGRLDVAYANLHLELKHHHESEDRLIYPFVAKVESASELLRAMDDEHHAMADALAVTRSAMAAYASSASTADALGARDSVARTRVVVDQHLTHEENEFEPLVWPYLETSEWKALEKQTRPASLAASGSFLAWLQDGMIDEHRTYLRSQIPTPVTFLLSRLAGRAYYRDVASTWMDSAGDSADVLNGDG